MKLITLILLMLASGIAFCNVVPAFSCDATRGCSPLVVNISDQSSPNTTSWHWDLGNGNTSNQRNPSATYSNPGTYTVKLIVSDGGSTDSVTQVITVFRKPVVDFATDRRTACPNDSIRFSTILTPGDAPVERYAWGFGNGIGRDSMNTIYRYSQAGIYDVTLVVLDTNGCTANVTKSAYIQIWAAPVADFSVTPAVSCGTSQLATFVNRSLGTGLTYLWNFGDSVRSSATDTTHLYSYGKYAASLVATNSNGCKSSISKPIAIVNLQAVFSADKTVACAGEEINFYNQSPMPGTIWAWKFGDGDSSNKQQPKHIYTTPGLYTVSFTIKDANCKDSLIKVSYVRINQGFTLSFTPDQRHSCSTPFTVNYTSTASTSVHYAWDFGNGHSDSIANPSETYTTASTFNVSLTATDSNGCTVKVTSPGLITTQKPWVNFVADTLMCLGQPTHFANRTTGGVRYHWNFGDGDTSSALNPIHTYRTYGRYDVSLTSMDSIGCDSTMTKHNLAHVDSTKIDFTVGQAFSMCPPLVTGFRSVRNRNDLRLRWDFGDGYTDTAANPTHIFFHPGVYTVKLVAMSPYGCGDSVVYPQMITVQGPSGHFAVTPTSGCLPLVVNFTGSASANTAHITCDLGNGTLLNDSLNFNYTYTSDRIYHPKFILTDHVGCSIPFDLDSIVALPLPVLHVQDTTVCIGQSVNMALGPDHYSWTAKVCDTCGRVPNVTDTVAVSTLSPQVTTGYTVTATNSYGCTATGHFNVGVTQMQYLTPHDTVTLCQNESVTLGSVPADSTRWTPSTYLSSPTAVSPVCVPSSSLSYTVIAYDKAGCAKSQQVPVKVKTKVTVAISGDTSVCPNGSVRLSVSAIDTSAQGVSYAWSPASYLDNSDHSSAVAQMQTSTETFRVITSSGGCAPDTSSMTVVVHSSASVKLPGTVTTVAHADVPLEPVSGDLTSFVWTARDSLSCRDCKSTTLVPDASQIVYLSGTNEHGCTASDSMFINVLPCDPESIFVPNTFTPNGDGLHDMLYLHSRTLSHLESFEVFDRWGALVYDGRDIANGWDGTINGKAAETGVYIFIVKGKCDNGYDVTKTGSVTLIR